MAGPDIPDFYMPFNDLMPVFDFSDDDTRKIQETIANAYAKSATFKGLVDAAEAARKSAPERFLLIEAKSDENILARYRVEDTTTDIGAVELNPTRIGDESATNFYVFVASDGVAHRYSLDDILIHELVHGLTAVAGGFLRDVPRWPNDEAFTTSGPTVDIENKVRSELGWPERLSYDGVGKNDEDLVAGIDYTPDLPDTGPDALVSHVINLGYSQGNYISGAGEDATLDMSGLEQTPMGQPTNDLLFGAITYDNEILAGGGDDHVYGQGQNDSLSGDAGNDRLFGRAGNDTLEGGEGSDTIDGGDGEDFAIYDGASKDYQIISHPDGLIEIKQPNGVSDFLRSVEYASFFQPSEPLETVDLAPFTTPPIEVELERLGSELLETISNAVAALEDLDVADNTPVIEDKADAAVNTARDQATLKLQDVASQIEGVFNTLVADPIAQELLATALAEALNSIDGVDAVRLAATGTRAQTETTTDDGIQSSIEPAPLSGAENPSNQVLVTISGMEEVLETSVGLSTNLGFNKSGLSFGANADVTAELSYELPFLIDLGADSVDRFLTFLSERDVEATLKVEADIDVEANAKLGFLEVTATELDNTADPDVSLTLTADFTEAGGVTPDIALKGNAGLSVDVESKEVLVDVGDLQVPVLPALGATLNFGITYGEGTDPDAPVGTFNAGVDDIRVELLSIARLIDGIFDQFDSFLDEFPVRQILDFLSEPIPVLDPLLNGTSFDPPRDEDVDPNFTVLDLMILAADFQRAPDAPTDSSDPETSQLDRSINALIALKRLDQLQMAIDEELEKTDGNFVLNLGSASVAQEDGDGVQQGDIVVGDDKLSLDQFFTSFGDLIALFALPQTTGEGETPAAAASRSAAAPGSTTPITANAVDDDQNGKLDFPLLESPDALIEALAGILLNNFGAEPMELIEYTLPEINFDIAATFAKFPVPPIPGLLVELKGAIGTAMQFGVGYDTAGFSAESFDFPDGFYLFGALNGNAVAEITAGLSTEAGLGVQGVGASASVEGGLFGTIAAYFQQDDKNRLSDFDCLIGAISGQLAVELSARAEIGFGGFSIGKSVDLGPFILAQFEMRPICPPSVGGTPELERTDGTGLARIDSADTGTLLLHVGAQASQRQLGDIESGGLVTDEVFTVSAVSDEDGTGDVFVNAFGLVQRFGSDELADVRADAGDGNDRIFLNPGVTSGGDELRAIFDGGTGDDILGGGNAGDRLSGDDDNDLLIGNGGNDELIGGAGDDTLVGGDGADTLIGGAGDADAADYSQSSAGVTLTFVADNPGIPNVGALQGSGGEAAGDVITGIEYLIGSEHDDTLQALPDTAMVLEGNGGDDRLEGGAQADLFIGGAGADTMIGDVRGADTVADATTYAFANSAVTVNLLTGQGARGEAQGDRYSGIENAQLTAFDDVFVGSFADNSVEGGAGDDSLQSVGGVDTIVGGTGNDSIGGALSGAILDGGLFTSALSLAPTAADDPAALGFDLAALRAETDLLDYSDAFEGVRVTLLSFFAQGTGFAQAISGGPIDILQGEILWPTAGTPTLRGDGTDNSFEDVHGSLYDDSITGDTDDNRLDGQDGNDTIIGGQGRDLLIGGFGSNILSGGEGNDTLDGALGINDMDGGAGRDLADWSGRLDGAVNASLSTGTAALRPQNPDGSNPGAEIEIGSLAAIENLTGTGFNDTLEGDGQGNIIDSGGLLLNGGTESLIGGAGTDRAVIDVTQDLEERTLLLSVDATGNGTGEVSNDDDGLAFLTLSGMEQLHVFAGGGDDVIGSAQQAHDWVRSGGGDDSLSLGGGADRVDAGAGDDTVYRIDPLAFVFVQPTVSTDFDGPFLLDGGRGRDSLAIDLSFETTDRTLLLDDPASGSFRIVTESGGVARDFEVLEALVAGSGNDEIGQRGRADNLLYGMGGNDTVHTGFGFDAAFGGSGIDRLVIDYSAAAPGLYMDALTQPSTDGLPPIVARLLDVATGTVVDSSVRAEGFEGFDLIGTDEADFLIGSTGNDSIIGGLGADTLGGAGGFDTLVGGDGADVFNVAVGGFGTTTIDDFDGLSGDRVQLVGQAQDYDFVNQGPGEWSVIYQGGLAPETVLIINATGSFDADTDVVYTKGITGAASAGRSDSQAVISAANLGLSIPHIETGIAKDDVAALLVASLSRQIDLPGLESTPEEDFPDILGIDLALEGTGEAAGTHGGILNGAGLVLSTGRVEELLDQDSENGATLAGGLAEPIALTFERVGNFNLGNGELLDDIHLWRATLPSDVSLSALTLSDPGDLLSSGVNTGSDLEAILISDKEFTSIPLGDDGQPVAYDGLEAALAPADASIADLLVLEQDFITFNPGTVNGPGFSLTGALPGELVDVTALDFGFGDSPGWLSLGDQGSITFDLAEPTTPGEQLYLYVTELGVSEELSGGLTGSVLPTRPPGDLSTDLGRPGLEGDTTRFVFNFSLEGAADSSGSNEEPQELDLFEITIVSEEFPERTAFEIGDLISIKVDGEDALVVDEAISRPFSELTPALGLALTPQEDDTPIRGDAISTTFRIAAPISFNNAHEVEIIVADQEDALLDTAIFLSPISRRFERGTEEADFLDGGNEDGVEFAGLGGSDSITGSTGADILRGGAGNDGIFSMGGDDLLIGGTGDDFFELSSGNQTVRGGTGEDLVIVSPLSPDDVTLSYDGDAWIMQSTAGGIDRLIDVEQITFASFGITVDLPTNFSGLFGTTQTPNIAPIAQADAIGVDVLRLADGTQQITVPNVLNLLENDHDLDGPDGLSIGLARLTEGVVAFPEAGQPFVLEGDLGTLTVNLDGTTLFDPDTIAIAALETGTAEETFLYRAYDGGRGSADTEITVSFLISEALELTDDTAQVLSGRSVFIDVLANDFAATSIVGVAPGSLGTAGILDGRVIYTARPGTSGEDTFFYVASDASGQATVANVTVEILEDDGSLNTPPQAEDDSYVTRPGQAITITAPGILENDSDDDGDALQVIIDTRPLNGDLILGLDGAFTYTPDDGFSGADSFIYTLFDGAELATGMVNIDVANAAPAPLSDTAITQVDTPITIDVRANDSDPDSDGFAITNTRPAIGGTPSIDDNGTPDDPIDDTILFTPDAGFGGTALFTYTVTDTFGASTTTFVSVSVIDEVDTRAFADGRIREIELADGRAVRSTITDAGDATSWQEVVTTFDTDGDPASRVRTYDDGRLVETLWEDGILTQRTVSDPDDVRSWAEIVTFFNADGTVASRSQTFDDGRLNETVWDGGMPTQRTQSDPADVLPWAEIITLFNPDGSPASRSQTFDDGRVKQTTYEDGLPTLAVTDDLADAFDWARITDTYDDTGDLISRTRLYDDGSEEVINFVDDLPIG